MARSPLPDARTALLPAQASIISEQAVAEHILNRYPLDGELRCRFHKHGVNDTYHIVGGDGLHRYLRIYTPRYANSDAIQREVDQLISLQDNGVTVGTPLADRDGHIIQPLMAAEGRRYAVLFSGTAQATLDMADLQQVTAFGAWTGAFHAVCDNLDLPGVRAPLTTQRLIRDNLELFLPGLLQRPKDAVFARRLAAELTDKLNALQSASPDFGIIHGDLHGGNATYHPHSGVQVFDFADSAHGWRLYDLGVVLKAIQGATKTKRQRVRAWRGFIRAYRSRRALDNQAVEAAPLFVMLKHFWLLGFHTTMRERHGQDGCNDRYYDAMFNSLRQTACELALDAATA